MIIKLMACLILLSSLSYGATQETWPSSVGSTNNWACIVASCNKVTSVTTCEDPEFGCSDGVKSSTNTQKQQFNMNDPTNMPADAINITATTNFAYIRGGASNGSFRVNITVSAATTNGTTTSSTAIGSYGGEVLAEPNGGGWTPTEANDAIIELECLNSSETQICCVSVVWGWDIPVTDIKSRYIANTLGGFYKANQLNRLY